MAIIGDAYIEIHARTVGFQKEVRDALNNLNVDGAARKAGSRAGKEFVAAFKKATGNKSILSEFNKTLSTKTNTNTGPTRLGRKFGTEFVKGFRETSDKRLFASFRRALIDARTTLAPISFNTGRELGKRFAEGFREAASGNMFSAFERQAADLINNAAKVSRAAGRPGALQAQAEAARQAFNSLLQKGYFIGPMISGVVSAISDLIFALVAMVSAVGTAAPSLAILGNGFAALAQGAITAKLAFGGIGKAIQAINSTKDSGGTNNTAVEDARRRLALVYQRTAETMAAANDKVRKAQLELNSAYKQAAETLQQLAFDSEEAALSQDKAAIALERAREAMMRSQDLPVNDRARRETELAFKEAELNYRRSVDRTNDLRKQEEYAAQTGIEGTNEVLKAKENLAEAEASRAKQQRDNAQDIAEAQRAVARALADSSKSSNKLAEAMKDLSPAAQMFARYIASLKPILIDLRAAAGSRLFGALIAGVDNLVTNLLPAFKKVVASTGRVLGTFFQRISAVFGADIGIIDRVFGRSNLVILDNLSKAFSSLVKVFLEVVDATAPLAEEFSKFVADFMQAKVISVSIQNNFGTLRQKFLRAANAAKIIGSALASLYRGFREFGRGASDVGLDLFKSLDGVGKKLQEFSAKANATGKLQAKFAAIGENTKSIGRFLNEIIKALFTIAGAQGVKIFFDTIKPIPGILAQISNTLTSGNIAKSMGEFFVTLTKIIAAFADTGGINNFFTIINKVATVFLTIANSAVGRVLFTVLAAAHGITLAFSLLFKVTRFGFNVMLGNIFLVTGALGKMVTRMNAVTTSATAMAGSMAASTAAGATGMAAMFPILGRFKESFAAMKMSFYQVFFQLVQRFPIIGRTVLGLSRAIPIIGQIIAVLTFLYQVSEKFRNSVSKAFSGKTGIFTAFRQALAGISDAWNSLTKSWNEATKKGTALGKLFDALGGWAGSAIEGLGTIIYGIIRAIGILIEYTIRLFDLAMKGVDWFVNGGLVKTVTDSIVGWAGSFFGLTVNSDDLTESQKKLKTATESSDTAFLKIKKTAEKLSTVYGGLEGAQKKITTALLYVYDATFAASDAFLAAYDSTKKLKDMQKTLNDTLKQANGDRALQKDALIEYGRQIRENARAVLESGGSTQEVVDIIRKGRQTFLDAADDFGYGAKKAQDLAQSLGLTPEKIKKTFIITGLKDLQEAANTLEAFKESYKESLRAGVMSEQQSDAIARKEAQLVIGMEKVFGKGQSKEDPLYVQVVKGLVTVQNGKKAAGGPVSSGRTYLVGEEGPELFSPSTSGTIIPNDKVGAAAANVTVNVHPSPGMDERTIGLIASREIAWKLRRGT